MIQLVREKSIKHEGTIVHVVGKKVPESLQSNKSLKVFSEQFLKGSDSFEYLKTVEGHVFFIKGDQTPEQLRVAGSKVLNQLTKDEQKISLDGAPAAVYFVLEGILLGSYKYAKLFSKADKKKERISIIQVPDTLSAKKCDELKAIQQAVFWARDRVNDPVNYLNAEQLAAQIAQLGEHTGLSVQILEKTQIESLKMGGLLGVNKGSIDPPTFTIIEYKPKNAKNKKPVVLVGKGVVYDTGGLSLKPTPGSMDCMKSDMAGAACMAGVIYLAALQKLDVHLIALIPATDNRPGMQAYTPGDVLTMYDGTTVEVLNTDAEGRLILADALAYANKYKPELVIDAATLTGAALRAIGTHASVIMGNASDAKFKKLEEAGEEVFERVVRFPFWEEYGEEMKSTIADLKNIGGPNAGMISAGKFLEHFVKAPYIHMDIAGPAWLDKKEHYRTQGGTGAGIRLLYQFFKNY
jgi:leucyl aminopeptidase